jgi:hypothetical protein
MLGLLTLVVIIVLAVAFVRRFDPQSTAECFVQNRVRVNYKDGTIRLAGRTFPVSAVTGIRWEQFQHRSAAIIQLADLDMPLYRTRFIGASGGEAFAQRLQTALNKAAEISSARPRK